MYTQRLSLASYSLLLILATACSGDDTTTASESDNSSTSTTPDTTAGSSSGTVADTDTDTDTDTDAATDGVNPTSGGGQTSCQDPALTLCNGYCVDLQTDADFCGSCESPCDFGWACVAGSCELDCGSLTDCNGFCVDTDYNPFHCGGCGNTCSDDQTCAAGSCIDACEKLEKVCGDVCTDTQQDPNNCGGCGNVCPAPASNGVGRCDGLGDCKFACDDYYGAFPLGDPTGCSLCDDTEVMADSPVHWWKLSELNGTVAVDSVGNADGEYVELDAITLGQDGAFMPDDKAIEIAKSNGEPRVRIQNFDMPSQEFTVEVTLRLDETDDMVQPVQVALSLATSDELNNELAILQNHTGNNTKGLQIVINGNDHLVGKKINDGNWHHIAVRWKSEEPDEEAEIPAGLTLYVDGERISGNGTFAAGHAIAGGGVLVFGQEQDSLDGDYDPNQQLIGALDSVLIFDKALTKARIQEHANSIQCKKVYPEYVP